MTETGYAIGFLVVATVAVLIGMRVGWIRRVRRTEALVPALPAPPDDLGTLRAAAQGRYVATTPAGQWLERIAAHGLGNRSAVRLERYDAGFLITRSGAAALFLPAESLRGAGTARGMVGVGSSLLVLRWQLGGVTLDTGLRVRREHWPALTAALPALTKEHR